MSWLKIDDRVSHHKKMLAAGPAACWLWVCGLAYCQLHCTNGLIPSEALLWLGVKKPEPLVAKLVTARLWRVVDGGWQVHDFLKWNDSAEERQAKSDDKTTRQQRWRDKKRRRDVDASTSESVDAAPTPTPTPPPKNTYTAAGAAGRPLGWKQALAIAHRVMDACPDRTDWTPEFKALCREQGLDYGEVDSQNRPMFARALDAAEGQRARRGDRRAS